LIDDRDRYSAKYFDAIKPLARSSAQVIVPMLLKLLSPRSVVDFGCGSGSWLAVFIESGVADVLGIDGEWIPEETLDIPKERFMPLDLENPVNLHRQFDLVLALEVAEHLSPSSADTFVDNLTKAGPVVLFSAAIPFQGGPHHVNEQWPGYWIDKFIKRNYSVIDCIRKRVWSDPRVSWFYAQNSFVFARRETIEKTPSLSRELSEDSDLPRSLVHPRRYLQIADPSNRTLTGLFWDSIRWFKRRGSHGR